MALSQKLMLAAVIAVSLVGSTGVLAESCSYNEAMMAFQQGNALRGQALLTMAAKDGDPRALALFVSLKEALQAGDTAEVLRVVLADSKKQ